MHNLVILRRLLPDTWDGMRHLHGDLQDLTVWAIEARYPGEWSEPTKIDAIGAESKARSIYDFVEGEFRRRGMFD